MSARTARWVASSETCGLDIIGATYIDDVGAGEMIHFRVGEPEPLRSRWCEEPAKLCVFEMIYFARPDSRFFGESLYSYRVRIGEALARETPVEADLVIGVPDSGIPAAIGYSQVSGIAFADGLIKNRYVGRTFIQPTQAMREAGIRVKLNPLPDVLSGKRVVVIDDSIVRGTTSRKLVAALREAGATEVHMRISSPPVTHPCFYGIDTDTQDQLIAARLTLAEISASRRRFAGLPQQAGHGGRGPGQFQPLLHRLLRRCLSDRPAGRGEGQQADARTGRPGAGRLKRDLRSSRSCLRRSAGDQWHQGLNRFPRAQPQQFAVAAAVLAFEICGGEPHAAHL